MNKKIYEDLGNSNYKLFVGDKRIVDCINEQEVLAGIFDMKKLMTELQKLFLEDNNNILESKMSEEYLEIAGYIRKELLDLDNLTLSQLEHLEKIDKITEFYEDICSDYYNTYKVIYAILTAKVNELNKQDSNYIENDTFKLMCITHVKKHIDSLFDLVLEKLNINKKELEEAFNSI